MIDGQDVERAAPTVPAIARIELQADHCKGIHTEANCALGKTRVEVGDDGMCPCFGVAVSVALTAVVSCGGAIAVITVEIEVSVQYREATAFNEPFRLFFSLS
ncbi:hypothetical protein D3C77_661290 [compost metagenome]